MGFSLGPRALSAGYKLAAFDSTGSTNVEAMDRARSGERGPMWFVTSEQTAGRGRRHRPWIAPRGNLASTILEVIDVSPAIAATLGFAAGLALEAALQRVSMEALLRSPGSEEMKFSLKWPNDVLAGRNKLAGILLEAETVADDRLAVVVGIGTNVVASPEGTPYPTTSLNALGVNIGAEDLFSALSDSWAEYRGIWDNGRGFGEIRTSWLDRAAGLGQPVSVQSGTSTISGIFDTIDESGCLIVSTSDGKRIPISAGDVYFGSSASAGATQ
ncbi:BirA family biotin operon repressor/biotin-[acetyl-CoA-carboxylase] ligase [Nitrobacteraceae bacterium AZCC 2161]